MSSDSGTTPSARRSPGEARAALIVSARELFAANGYSGTSTRQIAEHAGVNDSLFYRHFRTKAKLFDAAVVEPIREFVNRYVEEWADRKEVTAPAEVPALEFIGGLYNVLREHRTLLMSLLSAHAFDPHAFRSDGAGAAPLTDVLTGLRGFVENAAEQNRFTWLDPALAIRFTVEFVMSVAVLDDLLFPDENQPLGRNELVWELVQFVINGIGHPRTDLPASTSTRTPAGT